ncbi:MAG: hypothetical protein AMK75_04435 [Planctomycetes bacterium SM23_65]|nr:MAG: hypothetical protein AMK75_04435 [Planctomycetes bacterium SM23_65]
MARSYRSEGYWSAVLRNGLSKLMVLQALREGPVHGYALIRRVETMTDGFCAPTQGTVYPALREFERSGCVRHRVELVRGRQRKVYRLTAKGRDALGAGLTAWKRALVCIRKALDRH